LYRIKSLYLLVAACLILVGMSGFLKAQTPMSSGQSAKPTASVASEPAPLNYEFFKEMVEPIYVRKRPGHARCFQCHGDPRIRIMRLVHLPHGVTTWTDEESRKNFESVKGVAFPGDLDSPLLVHPLATEAGGDPAHTGGKHFQTKDDPEWLTLRAFVMGATLPQQ